MDAPSADSLAAADQALAGLDQMLVTGHTDFDAGTLHYSTAAALVRRWPARYVIERVRQRRIRRIAGPETGEHAVSEQDRLRAVAQAIAGCKATLDELTGERDQLVRVLHEQGLTLRGIAPLADLSHVTVGEIVNGHAYGPGRPWPYDGAEGRARLTGSLDIGGTDDDTERDDTEQEFGTPDERVLGGMRSAHSDGRGEWLDVTLVAEYAGMQPGQAAEVLAGLVAAGLVLQRGRRGAIYRLTP